MKTLVGIFFLCACTASAQTTNALHGIVFDYRVCEVTNKFFTVFRSTNNWQWESFALIDPQSGTNAQAFYVVAVDYKTNMPPLIFPPTNSLTAQPKAGALKFPR